MFDLEMTVPNLIGLLMILGTPNGIVISLDVEKYLKELINRLYRNESHAQLFDNVIQPLLFSGFLPDIFLWSPVKQLHIPLFCPIHGIPLQDVIDPTNLCLPQWEVSSLLFCLPIYNATS